MDIGRAPIDHYSYWPYCGAPPDPAGLLQRWNLDPILLIGVFGVFGLILAVPRTSPWRRNCFLAGWAVVSVALVSPLCALSVALFSARVGQHMILTMVAAPLVALGLPAAKARGEIAAASVFAVVLWAWHAPGPYDATFDGPFVYWLMHLSTFAAALWLWRSLLAAPARRIGPFLAGAALTTLQMGFLGALITFAGRPLYPVHALTTVSWGLTPLQDQQLGGSIMWIPAGVVLMGAVVAAMSLVLRRDARSVPAAAL